MAVDVFFCIEVDVPAFVGPGGNGVGCCGTEDVLEGVEVFGAEGFGGFAFELLADALDGVGVAGDDEVDVFGEDGAGVEDESGSGDGVLEAVGDGEALMAGEGDGWVVEGRGLRRRRSWGSCWAAARERRVETFVAGPNLASSQERTKSDQEPRGSLGSQKP